MSRAHMWLVGSSAQNFHRAHSVAEVNRSQLSFHSPQQRNNIADEKARSHHSREETTHSTWIEITGWHGGNSLFLCLVNNWLLPQLCVLVFLFTLSSSNREKKLRREEENKHSLIIKSARGWELGKCHYYAECTSEKSKACLQHFSVTAADALQFTP